MSRIDALQTTLAAEHAAIWVYAALGAQTSQSGTPDLFATVTESYLLHQSRREELLALIRADGAEPVASAAGYELPADLSTPETVTRRALRLEQSVAATYAYLVASTTGDDRAWAIAALRDAATRQLAFGGRPEDLPGL